MSNTQEEHNAMEKPPVPPADPDTFRRLVERKITPDEYVRKLDERVQETRESTRPASSERSGHEGE